MIFTINNIICNINSIGSHLLFVSTGFSKLAMFPFFQFPGAIVVYRELNGALEKAIQILMVH